MEFEFVLSGAEAFSIILLAFALGLLLGRWGEARIWRGKGDHEYMNRMASGKGLYIVKREK